MQAQAHQRVLVYVLCHDDASEAHAHHAFGAYPWAHVLRMTTGTGRCETQGILDAARRCDADRWWARAYVGFLQYSSATKPSSNGTTVLQVVLEFVERVERGDAACPDDVFAFSRARYADPRGDACVDVHGDAYERVWSERVAPLVAAPVFRTFFCNQFVARPMLVARYAAWLQDVALPRIEADGRAHAPAFDSARRVDYKPPPAALRDAGYADWPLLPFILERVSGAYFATLAATLGVRIGGAPHIAT